MSPLVLLPLLVTAAAAPPVKIVAGPLTLTLHRALAPQRFHVIDQLAAWSPYSHTQYARALAADPRTALSPEEQRLLDQHRTLRQRLHYGVLEEVNYRDQGWQEALDAAVKDGRLTAEEAALERKLVATLAPKVDQLLAQEQAAVAAFIADLERRKDELARFATKASRFCMGGRVEVSAFVIGSPGIGSGGGGYNGGVLTVEVGEGVAGFGVLLHESWHAFVKTQEAVLNQAARAGGVDAEMLNEGLAYAIYPGLFHEGTNGADPLVTAVAADLAAHKSWSEAFPRDNRFGLALRPLLAAALDDPNQTLATFLPRAIDVFHAAASLSLALDRPAPPRAFIFFGSAAAGRVLAQRIHDQAKVSIWSRPLEERFVRELLADLRPPDRVVFLLTPESLAHPPPASEPFLSPILAELRAAAADKRTIERQTSVNGNQALFLTAPDDATLEALAKTTSAGDRLFPIATDKQP